ncbi:MAG: poly-beta-1,6-N-acetyl-D-glucosamine biosynthesis protein PgaD [Actinotalea sp.]|nr:poly-beta-1,6-N-acetyl-D-glucosamine biosynthesis protein PgaD [Actinotalea sp.]
MRTQDAVISRPERVPRVRHGVFTALTAVAWTGFVWLLAPLLTLLLWAAGAATLYEEAVARFGDVQPGVLVGVIGAALGLAAVLVVWAQGQRRRFAGAERRRRPEDVEQSEVAAALGASPDVTAVLRTGRVVVVHVDEAGRPVRAEVVPASWSGVPAPRRAPVGGTVTPEPPSALEPAPVP